MTAQEWIAAVQERLPEGFTATDAIEFDAGSQIGVEISKMRDDGVLHRWASRAPIAAPDAVEQLIAGLSRAWT